MGLRRAGGVLRLAPTRSTTLRWLPPATSSSPPAPLTPWRRWPRLRKTGLWASQEVRDSLWPAQDQRTRPLDAAPPGPHGHAGGGGLSSTTWCWRPTGGASWSRGAPPRSWCWPKRRRTPRSTGNGSRPPSWPWTWTTGRSPTSPPRLSAQRQLHLTAATASRRHEGPACSLPGNGRGPRFFSRNNPVHTLKARRLHQ